MTEQGVITLAYYLTFAVCFIAFLRWVYKTFRES